MNAQFRMPGTFSRRRALIMAGASTATAITMTPTIATAATSGAVTGRDRRVPRWLEFDQISDTDNADLDIHVGPEVVIVSSPDPHQFPATFAWTVIAGGEPVRKVGLAINRNADSGTAVPDVLSKYSLDGGATWTDSAENTAPGFQLRDGTLIDFNFQTFMAPGSSDTEAEVPFTYSTDGGLTYVSSSGTLTTDRPMQRLEGSSRPGLDRGGFYFHGRGFEGPDGTFYHPAYGRYADDTKFRSVLMHSSDRGLNWTIKSTLAVNPNLLPAPFDDVYEGFNETAIEVLNDGSLLAIIRTGSWRPLFATRSDDLGATWSDPEMMRAGPDQQIIPGVNPKLLLMPNGVLAMMTGRDNTRLYVSADGRGEAWSSPVEVSIGRDSGNGGLEILDANRLLIVGDKGHFPGRPPISPDPYLIWAKTVTVVRRPTNRLPLRELYDNGGISVATNLTATSSANPGIGVAAAFSGITGFNNSAMSAANVTAGEFTIDLKSAQVLTGIGVALDTWKQQQYTIEVSTNGTGWTQVKQVTGHSSSLLYSDLGNRTVRYVRIGIDAAAGPAILGGVELYTTTMTFENDAIGAKPAGFDAKFSDVVSDRRSLTGTRSLRLYGTSSTTTQTLTYVHPQPLSAATFGFNILPIAIPSSAITCSVLGYLMAKPGTLNPIFHLAFRAGGVVEWWNGTAWTRIGAAGTLTFGQWNSVRLDAPADRTASAQLTINGTTLAPVGIATPKNVDIKGFRFTTSESAFVGQDAYIDNVSFTPAS